MEGEGGGEKGRRSDRQQGGVHIGDSWCYRCRVCSRTNFAIKEGSDCCSVVNMKGGREEEGVVCVTKQKRQWLVGWGRRREEEEEKELMHDEGSFGIFTPGWVSVAEEQLCRRLLIPGF